MAGDWIKLEKCTPDKPEIIRMSQALQIDQDSIVGKLIRVWSWFDDQTQNGNAMSVTESFVDTHVRVTHFARAMEKVGWLEIKSDGIVMPKFDRHNGQSAKRRALTAKRVKKLRGKTSNASVTPTALPEKRREEKRNVINPPAPLWGESLPSDLERDAGFKAAWSQWERHREEIRKPLKPTSRAAQLKKLEEMGPVRAVAALQHTIAQGWQGIREPDLDQSSQPSQSLDLAELARKSRGPKSD